MLSSTIVAQDFFDALTAEAAVNVHDVARLSRFASGEAVTAGAGTGLARVSAVKKIRARYRAMVIETVKSDKDWKKVNEWVAMRCDRRTTSEALRVTDILNDCSHQMMLSCCS